MENNPKKSKAFIIAFILVLLLLLIGYYIYSNKNAIFDTKGATSLSKIFAPLLGTSKDKGLNVINVGTTDKTGTTTTGPITGVILTDQKGNRLVLAEAGEDIKKGDAVYVSGFNKNKNPIIMRAIANDKTKSLVLGLADSDIKKGTTGNIIIKGILSGVNTQRVEITPWVINNPLYLSDAALGASTKNPPSNTSSFVITIGSVLKVNPIDGMINVNLIDYAALIKKLGLGVGSNTILNYMNSIGPLVLGINPNIFNNFPQLPVEIPGGNVVGGGYDSNFPTVSMTALKSSILENDSTTIRWTSTKTTSCDAGKGNGTGTSGSFETGPLTKTTSFAVTCKGPGGSNGATTFVIVTKPGGGGGITFPDIRVTATPSSIKSGESSLITWETTNTTSCKLSGGGITGTGITNAIGVTTGPLKTSMVYTLSCVGANKMSLAMSVFVFVDEGIVDPPAFPTVKLTATPGTIKEGEFSTLTWVSTNSKSCKLSGGGLTNTGLNNTTGVKTGVIKIGTVYSIVCSGTYGDISDNAFISVIPDYKLPVVTVIATPPSIITGNTSTIKWTSINTTSCNAGTGNGTGVTGTFETEILTASRSYTVSCIGANGPANGTASIIVTEDPNDVVTEDPNAAKPECSDEIDNNNNNLIDAGEPNCHKGGDMTKDWVPEYTSESIPAPDDDATTVVNACLLVEKNPLVFTEEEQARLAVLLRKFYLISSTLKTTEDITTLYNEIEQQKNFINQTVALTKQCYLQTNYEDDGSVTVADGLGGGYNDFCLRNKNIAGCYTGEFKKEANADFKSKESNFTSSASTRHGNPWFSIDTTGTYPYTKGDSGYILPESLLSTAADPILCHAQSGYYYGMGLGTNPDGTAISGTSFDCDSLNNNLVGYSTCTKASPDPNLLKSTGCKFVDGVDFKNTERILNIW